MNAVSTPRPARQQRVRPRNSAAGHASALIPLRLFSAQLAPEVKPASPDPAACSISVPVPPARLTDDELIDFALLALRSPLWPSYPPATRQASAMALPPRPQINREPPV